MKNLQSLYTDFKNACCQLEKYWFLSLSFAIGSSDGMTNIIEDLISYNICLEQFFRYTINFGNRAQLIGQRLRYGIYFEFLYHFLECNKTQ